MKSSVYHSRTALEFEKVVGKFHPWKSKEQYAAATPSQPAKYFIQAPGKPRINLSGTL